MTNSLDRGRRNVSIGTMPAGTPFPDITAAPIPVTTTGVGVPFAVVSYEQLQPSTYGWDVHNPNAGTITVNLEVSLNLDNLDGDGNPTDWEVADSYTGAATYITRATTPVIARAVRLNVTSNAGAAPLTGRISQ